MLDIVRSNTQTPVTGPADASVRGVSDDGQISQAVSTNRSETQSTFKASFTVVSGSLFICHFAFVIEICVWCSRQR